ncbi:DUF551 domain-containing protein [Salmonella enterica]|uniref:DUF551 domain-containing protein n=1 Tax=Salmonella enterica TaxID=28901 RepID=UPI0028FC1ACC|nr:DUF551 domain-containing protein [Salmonella enterica]
MTTITNNKLPEWRTALDKCVENYQSTRAWYEENRDSPAALDDMERAEDQLANFVRKCGFSIVLSLLDEIDELQELRRNYLALRGEIEDVQSQLYEAENQANEYASELQERRKADNQEPAGYHVIKECGRVGCSVATLEEAEKTRDFWNKKWTIRPHFYSAAPVPVVPEECPAELPYAQVKAAADLYALCWQSGEVVTYTPAPEKATIWLNNYSGTCVQEYVKLERLQEALSGYSPVIPGGWISCSERMPDREYVLAGDFSGTHYLASIPNVQVGIYADWFDDEKPCWDDGDGNDLHLKEVTHWMQLPEPPQEVK